MQTRVGQLHRQPELSVTTRVSLPGTGAILTEILSYAPGAGSFRLLAFINVAGARVYIGGEEDPGNNEDGYGYYNPVNGAVGGYNPWTPGSHPIDCGPPSSGTTQYYIGEVPLVRGSRWLIGEYSDPDEVAAGEDYPNASSVTGCGDLGFGLEFLNSFGLVKVTFGSKAP